MTATLNAETVNTNITYEDQSSNRSQVCEEILVGLTASFKYIEPKYFYDEYGSGLFEKITKTDEYYPTRTEKSILKKYASEIAVVRKFDYCSMLFVQACMFLWIYLLIICKLLRLR
jgi:uncharacterized SAM-dependent methyltransferase